ncbi:MAG: hypothetical protein Q7S32_00885 [bacterium]|nr:hypothetical protein [bacterium]
MPIKFNKNFFIVAGAMAVMLVYFLLANPVLNDDGFHYEGFAESAAQGKIDFKNFYGFQGLSFLAVPIFWITHSSISIIITSIILYLLSLPLAYIIGREYYKDDRAGIIFMSLILLMPYVYTTMMRGFQEAALLFFILLILYGSIKKKAWTPLAWAVGGIVKPFALVLLPLWGKDFLNKKKLIWVAIAGIVGLLYLGTSYVQTGHVVNNAAINSYAGNFDTGNPPPLEESFTVGIKGFGRVVANLLLSSRKILLSPLVILLGGLALLKFKTLRLRKEIILVIILNILLVGSLTFSFSKYLLPMVVLLALASVSLLRVSWLVQLPVLIDSWFVFKPIYAYFGNNFWTNFPLYLIPFGLVIALLVINQLSTREEVSV